MKNIVTSGTIKPHEIQLNNYKIGEQQQQQKNN